MLYEQTYLTENDNLGIVSPLLNVRLLEQRRPEP